MGIFGGTCVIHVMYVCIDHMYVMYMNLYVFIWTSSGVCVAYELVVVYVLHMH
jgi:hypothetical protein